MNKKRVKISNKVLIVDLCAGCFLNQQNLHILVPEIFLLADCQITKFNNNDTQLFKYWKNIANFLNNQWDLYEGFIIIDDYLKIVSTSIAMKLMAINNNKPIVFIASKNRESNFLFTKNIDELDLRLNMINGLQVIKSKVRQIMIVDDEKVIDPFTALQSVVNNVPRIISFNQSYLAQLNNLQPTPKEYLAKKEPRKILTKFANRILIINYIDWLDNKQIYNIPDDIEGCGLYLNSALEPIFIEQLLSKLWPKPVLIGGPEYLLPDFMISDNVLYCPQHTWQANLIKMSWLLANCPNKKEFKNYFIKI